MKRTLANAKRLLEGRDMSLHPHAATRECTLVLLRHGESLWNRESRFTGWCDVELTSEGEEEAVDAGKVLAERGHRFDVAFTSELSRAYRTCESVLGQIPGNRRLLRQQDWQREALGLGTNSASVGLKNVDCGSLDLGSAGDPLPLDMDDTTQGLHHALAPRHHPPRAQHPSRWRGDVGDDDDDDDSTGGGRDSAGGVGLSGGGSGGKGVEWGGVTYVKSWRLNERHYGALQGLKKDDPMLKKRFSPELVDQWRRSYKARPPAMTSDHPYWRPPPAPLTESLEDCQLRVCAFYQEEIKPYLEAGAKVLVVAHANTLRALVKTVDDISDENIRGLRIPNSIPLVYRLDPDSMEPVAEADDWGFQGEYLTSWRRADTAVRAVERSQRRVLQALFRAMDKRDEGTISSAAFQKWVVGSGGGGGQLGSPDITDSWAARGGVNGVSVQSSARRLNSVTAAFFEKYGLLDSDRRIDFEEFIDLSAEFWDKRDHFRLLDLDNRDHFRLYENSFDP